MADEFKVGDIIIFNKDICSKEWNKLLIPAKQPCKILHITKDHIQVLYKKNLFKLRFIPERMLRLDGLAKALYS